MIGRKFPKIQQAHWRLRKARAAYLNRRQWNQDNLPEYSGPYEIELEQSVEGTRIYLYNEQDNAYIITE